MQRLATLILLVFLTGCCTCEVFVAKMENSWGVIGPKHKEYIRNDPTLTDAQKKLRIEATETVGRLIKKQKQNLGME